jgi:hypothetical protein
VSDQGSGWSTLYNGAGVKQSLVVSVPAAAGMPVGQPTEIVVNPSTSGEFAVQGEPVFFVFDSLDGTISAWAPGVNRFSAQLVKEIRRTKPPTQLSPLPITLRETPCLRWTTPITQSIFMTEPLP